MRLIDADATIIALLDLRNKKYESPDQEVKRLVYGLNRATFVVNEQPTIDAVPVAHGKWKTKVAYSRGSYYKALLECSRCGRLEHIMWDEDFPFCHCGAKMDLEVETDADN